MAKIILFSFLHTVRESFFFINLINLLVVQFLIFLGFAVENKIDILINILFVIIIDLISGGLSLFILLFITRIFLNYEKLSKNRA